MGRKCCVVRCPNSIRKPTGTVHRFPRIQLIRERWLQSLRGQLKNVNLENTGICNLHFSKDDYNHALPKDGRNGQLFSNAVPKVQKMLEPGKIQQLFYQFNGRVYKLMLRALQNKLHITNVNTLC